MATIITFMLWLFIGIYNLIFCDEITKYSYFFCWLVLMFYVLALELL